MLVPIRRACLWGLAILFMTGVTSGCNNTEVIPLEKERPIVIVSPPGSQAATKARQSNNDGVSGGSTDGEYRP